MIIAGLARARKRSSKGIGLEFETRLSRESFDTCKLSTEFFGMLQTGLIVESHRRALSLEIENLQSSAYVLK